MNNRTMILMSTYNGGYHIKEQIESILSQLGKEDCLLIRDDGSTDDTTTIIRTWNDSRIQFIPGNNIGFAHSFFWLLYHADEQYEVYMLSDQDDVWLPKKINRAKKKLLSTVEPHLFCTRLRLVNEKLQDLGLSPKYKKPASFTNAVCENIATGCTIALNNAAIKLIRKNSLSALIKHRVHYHDWWLYLNISYFGHVTWDAQPEILYRQHQHNLVGMSPGWKRYWLIWKAINTESWVRILVLQLRAFLDLNGSRLDAIDREWIASLCQGNAWQITLSLIKDSRLQRQQPLGKLLFRLLVAYDGARGKLNSIPYTISTDNNTT